MLSHLNLGAKTQLGQARGNLGPATAVVLARLSARQGSGADTQGAVSTGWAVPAPLQQAGAGSRQETCRAGKGAQDSGRGTGQTGGNARSGDPQVYRWITVSPGTSLQCFGPYGCVCKREGSSHSQQPGKEPPRPRGALCWAPELGWRNPQPLELVRAAAIYDIP